MLAQNFFDTKIEYLKGVGVSKALLLNTELHIFTYGDFIQYYPFRYEDRTRFYTIDSLNDTLEAAQIKGRLRYLEVIGEGFKARLVGQFSDGTGVLELVWFQGIAWLQKNLRVGSVYVIYGKPAFFQGKPQIQHPEMDLINAENEKGGFFQPVYGQTEKLRKRYLDSKAISNLQKHLLSISYQHIQETLPTSLIQKYKLVAKRDAVYNFHFPQSEAWLHQAKRRLKFEELFYNQLRLLKQKVHRRVDSKGQVFVDTNLVEDFCDNFLPFTLTDAQQKVIKEISRDMASGKQMNRLLQGDVGSGKTIVAFICMLMAIAGGTQACIIAPTEILADQHYQGLKKFSTLLGIDIYKLTGSVTKKNRQVIHEALLDGSLKILVGTHAILEDIVQFQNLGFVVIDEQHRFGVAQRAKLWAKNPVIPPHILVMTATPIPRTLAMTLYGDLDVSIINELPKGRKPIKTVHRYDSHRLNVFGFMKEEIQKGRQVYIVYPLIEESEKLDYKFLEDGYESICRAFPECKISIVHGKMKAKDKDFEMQRFVNNETQIMVATTVIEVGVNVPNASVMIIESAERFGLSQLHQLRGRVGRGAEQSYCILMSDVKLSKDTRTRLETMVRTSDGFEIADVDLQLRGPGDMSGTQQSGVIDLLVADLAKDGEILRVARECASEILTIDPNLNMPEHTMIKEQIEKKKNNESNWAKIS